MLVTRNRAHQQDVRLVVAVLSEVDPFRFLLDLIGPAVLRGEGEAIGKHHNGADLEAYVASVGSDFLKTLLIGNLDAGGEDAVRQN